MKNTWSANNWDIKNQKIYSNIHLWEYYALDFNPPKGSLIYLYGDLGMWKTTFTQVFLKRLLGQELSITSPTYTYYNIYDSHYYHFDLYRLSWYNEFFQIGGEDILLGREEGLIFVEWPERIDQYINPDYSIYISAWIDELHRNITITPQYLS